MNMVAKIIFLALARNQDPIIQLVATLLTELSRINIFN
jgi:hypothetical protein